MTVKNALGDMSLESTQQQEIDVLHSILSRLGFPDQTQGTLRVTLVNGTVTTVTSVTTMANQTSMGGYAANYDQYATMAQMIAPLRQQIIVT